MYRSVVYKNLMYNSDRIQGKEMVSKYEFNSVREMDKFFEDEGGWKKAMKRVMRPLKVKHL